MEKSGIDMLEEILVRLDKIEKVVSILDTNIKTLINTTKIADMVTKATNTPMDGWARAIPDVKKQVKMAKEDAKRGFVNFSFDEVDASKVNQNQMRGRSGNKKVLVKGKMVTNTDGGASALPNVSVKIYNDKDSLIKETKTNRAGMWMSHLPPGNYVALFEGEINGKKLVPQNRNFEVPSSLPPGQNEIEVV
jgi:hypothetical protein